MANAMWKIEELRFEIDEKIDIPGRIAKLLQISTEDITFWKISKKSLDARKKNKIYINFSVELDLREEIVKNKKSILEEKLKPQGKDFSVEEVIRKRKHSINPVIAGTGPSGLFSALWLVKKKYKPLILERGKKIPERTRDINLLWKEGRLNTESNVQFGEGGAGTFSDGKLVCRKNDPQIKEILNTFVTFGAPKEILYESKPHVGTDLIRKVILNIRKYLESMGAIFHFSSTLTGIDIKNNRIAGIRHKDNNYDTDAIILATGHSSGDTYEMLLKSNIAMEAKGFAIGFRIEHNQSLIDKAQFGKYGGHPLLGPAEYFLKYNDSLSGRGIYTFCMCPGGVIICASSREGELVLNGMSNYKRDSKKANSAVVVSVYPKDFYKKSILDGIDFQRKYERKAFILGGGDYKAPAEKTLSFMGKSENIIDFKTTYLPGVRPAKLEECFPHFLINPLKKGIENFSRKIKGFDQSVLIGIETRTSSPVRIVRNEDTRESINTGGLYPVGEGGGYAGGIISSALDGIKTARLF